MDFPIIYIAALILLWTSADCFRDTSNALLTCKYTLEFKRLTADCSNLKLHKVPTDLKSDILILFAPDNRIKELTNDSFLPYTSLEMIYLANNIIIHIDSGTFDAVPKLEVLDLSQNALRRLPGNLPLTLKKIYLHGNYETEIEPMNDAYNLQYLNLADNKLKSLPDIGMLPNLLELNISANPIATISATQLAPLCRLKLIYLPKNIFPNKRDCKCHEFVHWTTKYKIETTVHINCTQLREVEHALCISNHSAWYDVRQDCLSRTPPLWLMSFSNFLLIAGGSLIVAMCVICCCCRRSKSRKKRSSPPVTNHNSYNNRAQSPSAEQSSPKKSTIV